MTDGLPVKRRIIIVVSARRITSTMFVASRPGQPRMIYADVGSGCDCTSIVHKWQIPGAEQQLSAWQVNAGFDERQ